MTKLEAEEFVDTLMDLIHALPIQDSYDALASRRAQDKLIELLTDREDMD